MKFKQPHPTQREREQPTDRDGRIRVGLNRCPFCHEDVAPEESVACQACLARHHTPCWQESGACGACRSTEALAATSRAQEQSPNLETLPRGALGLVFMGLGAVVGGPLALWLKLVHDIDRVGAVPTFVFIFVPFLLGTWLNVAMSWKRMTPRRQLLTGVGLAVCTSLFLLATALWSLVHVP